MCVLPLGNGRPPFVYVPRESSSSYHIYWGFSLWGESRHPRKTVCEHLSLKLRLSPQLKCGPGLQLATAVCWISIFDLFPLSNAITPCLWISRNYGPSQGLALAKSPVPCVWPSCAETVICTLVRLYSLASGAVSVRSADWHTVFPFASWITSHGDGKNSRGQAFPSYSGGSGSPGPEEWSNTLLVFG